MPTPKSAGASATLKRPGNGQSRVVLSVFVSLVMVCFQLLAAVLMAGAYGLAGLLPLTVAYAAVVRPMNVQGPVGIVFSVPLGVIVGLVYFVVALAAGPRTYRTVTIIVCAGLVVLAACSIILFIPVLMRIRGA